MAQITYKGHILIPASWRLVGGKWLPRAVILKINNEIKVKKLPAKPDTRLDTRPLADSYAVKMAKKWIDDQG